MQKNTLKLPKAEIEIEVRDKNGKLIKKKRFPAKSWVGNMVALISSMFSAWGYSSGMYGTAGRSDMKEIGGASRSLVLGNYAGANIGGNAPAGTDTVGICIGISDTPVSLGQYNLGGRITHGTGAGQMQYGAMTVESLNTDTSWFFRIIRTFTNASGGTITVREIGLFFRTGYSVSPYYADIMLARDVLPSPINVLNGQTLTVRYIITHSLA
jgi:hypothetical protein